MDQFRERLGEELSSLEPPAPALGDLIGTATRNGRRTRRVRSWAAAGGSAAALAAVGVLVATLSGGGRPVPVTAAGSPSAVNSPTQSAIVAPEPSASAVPSAPSSGAALPSATPAAGGSVPATAPGLLQALLPLLPPGRRDHFTGNPAPDVGVQTYLTTAAGTGMIRVHVTTHPGPATCGRDPQCHTDAYGHTVSVGRLTDNCIQSLSVFVNRGDGTGVQIDVASCLAWDGHTNPPGVQALTVDQAVAIADNPAIGPTLDAATVQAGAAAFPHLPPMP